MKKLVAIFSLAVLFFSCQPDPGATTPQIGTTGSFEVTMNGALWQGTSFQNSIITVNNQGYVGNRLDIRATGADGKTIILSVADPDRVHGEAWVSTGLYHSDSTNTEVLVTLMQGNSLTGMSGSLLLGHGWVNLTTCNSITQLCSGTFAFEIFNPNDTTLIATGVNGEFTNCQYTYYQ